MLYCYKVGYIQGRGATNQLYIQLWKHRRLFIHSVIQVLRIRLPNPVPCVFQSLLQEHEQFFLVPCQEPSALGKIIILLCIYIIVYK